jgi:hypothetical protein
MLRQCARPGCSAVATTTFTFDSREQTVWLDPPRDGAARAGELCARHTRVLAPPMGWHVIDRREAGKAAKPAPVAPKSALSAVAAAPAAPAEPVAWYPRFERGDSLDGVLEATTPLLARAFGNVRAI